MCKRAESCIYRGIDVLLASFLVNTDNFRGLRWINRTDLARRLAALAANDQIILATQLSAHFLDGRAHLAHVLFFAEIDKRLILECTLMQADVHRRCSFHGCHRRSFPGRIISADIRDL